MDDKLSVISGNMDQVSAYLLTTSLCRVLSNITLFSWETIDFPCFVLIPLCLDLISEM